MLRVSFALAHGLSAAVLLLWLVACGVVAQAQGAPGNVSVTQQPVDPAAGSQPAPSQWAQRAPLPEPNSEIAVAELDGKIYVIGGYPSTRAIVATVQVYDPATDSWTLTTPLPVPLHHTMAAAANGKLYVIGGETSPSRVAVGPTIYVDTVYQYDPATATWTQRAPMPTARSAGATAVIDGKIYVAGGRPPRGHDFAVYDPATDTWTVLPDLPTQRNHLAAAAINGKVYVAGGRFGGGVGSEMTAALEVYDPVTITWAALAPMSTPRGGVNGIAVNGCLYVFGGEGNDAHPLGMFDDVEVYNPVTNSWQRLDPMPVAVHGVTGAAFIDGWIHLPGGGTARGGSSGSTLHQVFRADLVCE
jgi:N-acetylneuraminic acid mutarotase